MSAPDLTPVELAQVQRFGMHLPERLRNVPTQKRSLARVEKMLEHAAAAYAEHGRDRFTTAQVAELSGASIGTIYRYFDDRVAIMDAIDPDRDKAAERNTEALAFVDKTIDNLQGLDYTKWRNDEVALLLDDIRSLLVVGEIVRAEVSA